MVRPRMTSCVFLLGSMSCASPSDDTITPYLGDTDVELEVPPCMVLSDRPPGNHHPWQFDGPADADVVWGVRPAASWDGMAALLAVGPGGGCGPCTLTSTDFGSLPRVASELALELELGCAAEVVQILPTSGVTGVRLNLHGADLAGHVSMFDLPLMLTTVDAAGDRCLADNVDGNATRHLRKDATVFEPGRTLDYRIPLGPLVAGAGYDPDTTYIHLYDLRLEVHSGSGATAWIEVGRTLMDGCE